MGKQMDLCPPIQAYQALLRIPKQKQSEVHIENEHTHTISTWIKSIAGNNNLTYFQSKLKPLIDPTCRLCLQTSPYDRLRSHYHTSTVHNEKRNSLTRHDLVSQRNKHLYTTATNPLPMTYDTQYNNREIEYMEHNYSSDDSSL